MYHELTTAEVSRRHKRHIMLAAVILAAVIAVYAIFTVVVANAREQGAASLRNAILDSANQCCAVEGSYPTSLSHLEESYGLRVNTTDYVITYEVYAANVMPSVVVVPR
jgi:hypothetical protein